VFAAALRAAGAARLAGMPVLAGTRK